MIPVPVMLKLKLVPVETPVPATLQICSVPTAVLVKVTVPGVAAMVNPTVPVLRLAPLPPVIADTTMLSGIVSFTLRVEPIGNVRELAAEHPGTSAVPAATVIDTGVIAEFVSALVPVTV